MNWFDLAIAIVLLASFVSGLRTGLARVVVGLGAAIVGFTAGFWFYGIVAAPLLPYVHSQMAANTIGFLTIFVACLIAGSLIALLLTHIFQWIGLSWFDHLLGGVAGLIRGALVAAVLVAIVMAFAPSPLPAYLSQSRLLPYATDVSATVAQLAPRGIKTAFDQQLEFLKHYPVARKAPHPETI